jgi:hypothetical protein
MPKRNKADALHDPVGPVEAPVLNAAMASVPGSASWDVDQQEAETQDAPDGKQRSIRKLRTRYVPGAVLLGVTAGILLIGLMAARRNGRRHR